MARQFLIAATKKSSGKTSVTLGLVNAFTRRGMKVQTFKKGPDYIDPLWLSQASGHPCYNLDFNTMDDDEIIEKYKSKAANCDLSIIETNKGLFDGLSTDGSDSNAALAKLLNIPVILVVDTIGMTRGIAPLLQGYAGFDNGVNIAGIILNKTGGPRHEEKLRAAIASYTDFSVLGAVRFDKALNIDERHLGLRTPNSSNPTRKLIKNLGNTIDSSLDLDGLLENSTLVPSVQTLNKTKPVSDVLIAVPRDEAFGFYYPDDLESFENAGAKLVFFDTINDDKLPDCDGLFVGGGFPEVHMKALESNNSMRQSIKTAIENGLPTYAECGGLMYLCNSINWRGENGNMVGVIDADAAMHLKPQGRGYAKLQPTPEHSWYCNNPELIPQLPVHEFHYAVLENLKPDVKFAHHVTRGHGINGAHDGIIYKNVIAGFCHFRDTKSTPWVAQFVNFVRGVKTRISGL